MIDISIKFLHYFIVGLILVGCSIMDMDRPLPPINLWWAKGLGSAAAVDLALRECGGQINVELIEDSSIIDDMNSRCMLKKGFKFVPHPKGWRNICALEAFHDGVGCKSSRGEIKITPD